MELHKIRIHSCFGQELRCDSQPISPRDVAHHGHQHRPGPQMGRRRRAAARDKDADVDHSSLFPPQPVDNRVAVRMVLQAMVAATGTNAAMPSRSGGDGQKKLGWMGKLVEHSNDDTSRGMGSSSERSRGDTVGHGGTGGEKNPWGWFNRGGQSENTNWSPEHPERLVGFPIPVRTSIPMVGKQLVQQRRAEERRKLDVGSDGSCSEPGVEVEEPAIQDRSIKGGRGSLEKVIQKKWNARQWKARSQTFCKKFLSWNTALSRNSKRRQMVTLLKQLKKEPLIPVNQEELTVLASMLDEAKLTSADQYLHEIKLMQVEMGGPWDPSMERQLALCKRALARHKGPEKRAVEVKLEDLTAETWSHQGRWMKEALKPAWSYAWATIWMLRAAEAVRVKFSHVKLTHNPRVVTLFIPKSKMDQRERGVSRTLKCNCMGECHTFCGWGLALQILSKSEVNSQKKWLFTNVKGDALSKSSMVSSWQRTLCQKMTGHSARRSGAMGHARRGMSLTNISFLGRWKSTAVFRYVEEALQFMPPNEDKVSFEDCTSKREDKYRELVTETKFMENLGPKNQGNKKRKSEDESKASVKVVQELRVEEAKELYAIAPTRNQGRIAHWVSKAAWGTDLDTWATSCGWRFARRCEKVTLMTEIPKNAHVCQKCEGIRKSRDVVKGGVTLAQMLAKTFGAN